MSDRLNILQHSLGLDRFGQGREYRNHFVTGPGSTAYSTCMELVRAGLMKVREPSELWGGDWLFTVTADGKSHVYTHSPKPPNQTRAQQRYVNWLNDEADMKFGEWLRSKWCRP